MNKISKSFKKNLDKIYCDYFAKKYSSLNNNNGFSVRKIKHFIQPGCIYPQIKIATCGKVVLAPIDQSTIQAKSPNEHCIEFKKKFEEIYEVSNTVSGGSKKDNSIFIDKIFNDIKPKTSNELIIGIFNYDVNKLGSKERLRLKNMQDWCEIFVRFMNAGQMEPKWETPDVLVGHMKGTDFGCRVRETVVQKGVMLAFYQRPVDTNQPWLSSINQDKIVKDLNNTNTVTVLGNYYTVCVVDREKLGIETAGRVKHMLRFNNNSFNLISSVAADIENWNVNSSKQFLEGGCIQIFATDRCVGTTINKDNVETVIEL